MTDVPQTNFSLDKQIRVALAVVSCGPVQKKQHWHDPGAWFDSLPKSEQQRLMGLAAREWERATKAGVSIEICGDDGYPPGFAALRNPPAVLYRLGQAIPRDPAVAVVGARAADGYGLAVSRQISCTLARHGALIVSGGAKGVDREAHESALDVGGKTVVFLASGLSVRQSADTRVLLDRVVRGGGSVVSEIPLDVAALKHRFPERNRLIAASADVTVVIQAAEQSGSLHTAHEAIRLGRPVLAVPGDVCYRLNIGSNGLLAGGRALALCHPEDVGRALNSVGRALAPRHDRIGKSWPDPGVRVDALPQAWRKSRQVSPAQTHNALWSFDVAPILDHIDAIPRPAEEIAERAGLPLPDVVSALSVLQLERRVMRVPGNRFVNTNPLTHGNGCE